ncbi:MAG: hypothetical protein GWO07_16100 [Candidatus Dadabacteria bacterium]|nr:hypothetical protein [Candidatus Dadabacteria bacterium]NIS10226.1 hypothetical protein [Candidatus Dadabacteria bacterium]NIV42671.1 hypothetical protein [Candidatus Dadabacteria bacterium]NIX16594.1 hypothetical protein [Candidatus Dadabacteria bacterium]NIY23141.1 hypothetical protein [Candidatus Dadabacteria bacterium]
MTAKIIGAVWPLIIFPIFIFLTVQGSFDFGGGEKDVVAIPLLAFTLMYLVSYIILVKKKKKRTFIAVMLSAGISLLLLFIITLVFAQLLGVKA